MNEFNLHKQPKISSGFITPDDRYFENLSKSILEQLPKNNPQVIPFYKNKTRILMMVAAVFIIALTIPSLLTSSYTSTDIDRTTLENYLSYQSNINQFDLINVLDFEDIENIETNIALEDQTIEEILVNNNNLEHFILE